MGSLSITLTAPAGCLPCCQPPSNGCCLYPAQAVWDGVILEDDLPDEIYGEDTGFTYTRDGTTFTSDEGDFSLRIIITAEGWEQQGKDEFGEWVSFDYKSQCLISSFEGDDILDGWPEELTLTVYCDYGNGNEFTLEYTLTRISLCVWEAAQPDSITLQYYEGDLDGNGVNEYFWKMDFGDDIFAKLSQQGTPLGSWTGLTAPCTATVYAALNSGFSSQETSHQYLTTY